MTEVVAGKDADNAATLADDTNDESKSTLVTLPTLHIAVCSPLLGATARTYPRYYILVVAESMLKRAAMDCADEYPAWLDPLLQLLELHFADALPTADDVRLLPVVDYARLLLQFVVADRQPAASERAFEALATLATSCADAGAAVCYIHHFHF